MKKVLIVFNDVVLLSVFKRWMLRSLTVEMLLFAKDGKKAIEIMAEHPIELLITDLELQDMSGMELVAFLSSHYPSVKVAFFLPLDSSINSESLAKLSSLYFVHKPESLKDFIRFEKLVSVAIFQTLAVADMLIVDFLKLAKYQYKTCLLEIDNLLTGEKGFIYFEAGVLHDAACGDFKAELAVVEMLSWKRGQFIFKEFAKKLLHRKIQSTLANLIEEGDSFKANAAMLESVATITEPEEEPITVNAEEASAENVVLIQQVAEQVAPSVEQAQLDEVLIVKIRALQLNEVLKPLQEFNHYLGFAIFDMTGQLLVAQGLNAFEETIEKISQHTVAIIIATSDIMPKIGLGKPFFIQISTDGAIFQLEWIIEKQLLAIILLNAEAKNTGLAKIHLDKACHYIRNELS